MTESASYGLWSLVVINSLVFIVFVFSFTRPRTGRDWRAFGAFAVRRRPFHRDVRRPANDLPVGGG